MYKKFLRTALLLALGLYSFSVQAINFLNVPPQVCPGVASIQSVGVSHNMTQGTDNLWFTGKLNQQYDTDNHWTFVIANIPAPCSDGAYNKAVTALDSLSFQVGPVIGPLGKWICFYTTAEGYEAVTIFPSM